MIVACDNSERHYDRLNTCKHNRQNEDCDSQTHHLDIVQRFFNTPEMRMLIADSDNRAAVLHFNRSLI